MKKKVFALVLCTALIAALFAGCSGSRDTANYSKSSDGAYRDDSGYYAATATEAKSDSDYYYYDEPDAYGEEASSLASLAVESAINSNRKIILTANIYMETKDFDNSVRLLREAVEELGGYISAADTSIYNSTYSLHHGYYTVRIPVEKFSDFITSSEKMGNVTSANVGQSDVTNSYNDIETRLETLYAQKDRLLALMDKAEDIDTIIALENALTETIYEIESLTSQRNRYDDQIAYSTAYVSIDEVRDLTPTVVPPKTLGERISQSFTSSWEDFGDGFEDFVVWLVEALPTLIVLAVIAVIIIVIIRATKPRRQRKRLEREEKQRAAAAAWQAAHAAPVQQAAPAPAAPVDPAPAEEQK